LLALAAALPAQTQMVTLPSPAPLVWLKNNFPVGAPPLRYQQWFTAAQWARTVSHPVRVVGLDLVASATAGGQLGSVIDIEVKLANGPAFLSQLMDANLTNPSAPFPTPAVLVIPRSQHALGPATPGTFPLQLTFVREFVWDGISSVVVEIKMWNNGMGNQTRPYDLQYAQNAGFEIGRMWGLSPDPNSVVNAGFVQQGNGVAMQFRYAEGVSVPYGRGCPGAGGHLPVASTTGGLPLPANSAWTQRVSAANSQKNAVLLIGGSNTMLGSVPLPFSLGFIGGFGCDLWTDIVVTIPALTVGGGPGAGTAAVATPIPPVTGFTGMSAYFQWLIWDQQSGNGVMAMSHGLQTIFG
jgi:hypothetical protein